MSVLIRKGRLFIWLFSLVFVFWALPADASVYPQASFIKILDTQDISTEDGIRLEIGLRNAAGQLPQQEPGGKIYLWAEEEGRISPKMTTLVRSLEPGVYMHDTAAPGILILDGKALHERDRIVGVQIPKSGLYSIKGVFVQESIDPFSAADYWPYQLGGLNASKQVQVQAAPSQAAHYMRVSPSVDGFHFPSQVSYRNGSMLYPDLKIPVSESLATHIDVRLSRRDGSNIGAGLPVQAEVLSQSVFMNQPLAITDAHGQASFSLQGLPQAGDRIRFRVDPDFELIMPLSAYSDKPLNIRLNINQNTMDVDGRLVALDSPAVVVSGRTYVPYRAISEALGAEIRYDHKIRTITTYFGNDIITMTIGHPQYARNNKIIPMDAMPYINNDGRTMVPIRFMAEATGYDVYPVTNERGAVVAVIITRP